MRIMKSRGFTLVELLVMIAVIGVLVAAVIANLNAAKVRAYNAKALTCARSIKTAEVQSQTRVNAFVDYASLEPGTIRACTFLTDSPPGRHDDSSYQFAVRHPQGSRTFLVSESDLRWTSQMPSASLVMSEGIPLTGVATSGGATSGGAGGNPPSGGDDPVTPPPSGTERLVLSLWFDGPAAQRGTLRNLRLTGPTGVAVPLNLVPSGRMFNYIVQTQTLENLAPGTYRLTVDGFNACVDNRRGITTGAICNRSPGVTRAQMDISVAGGSTDFVFTITAPYHSGYVNVLSIASNASLRNELLRRNIKGMSYVAAVNMSSPTSTDCVGNCTSNHPDWEPRAIHQEREVGWDGVLPAAISLSSIPGNVVLARYLAVDPSRPMNTAGLPSEQNIVLSNSDAIFMEITASDLSTLMNVQQRWYTDFVRTTYGSSVPNPWFSAARRLVDPL